MSLSVDPEFDTPEVLTRYAQGLGADPDRWWFLTGKQDQVVDLILNRFHLPVSRNEGADASDPDAKVEAVRHSPRLVLVDRGNKVVGFFDSDDPEAVGKLVTMATRKASWARRLPALNATLNGSCALLLLLGWVLIVSKNVRGHAACMIAAVSVSAVFLACYLVYHFQVGSVAYRGEGGSKFVYFTILLSHTVLATFGVVPLVSLTLIRAIRKEFHRHASIARVTFPIWLYVSITGVVIYWMLYQMPVLTLGFVTEPALGGLHRPCERPAGTCRGSPCSSWSGWRARPWAARTARRPSPTRTATPCASRTVTHGASSS